MNDTTTEFEPLQALSLARTALDDPGSLPVEVEPASLVDYAVDRIDEVIGALHFEPSNDYAGEARWVITHLGRLLAQVHDVLDSNSETDADRDAVGALAEAGDHIDEALDALA